MSAEARQSVSSCQLGACSVLRVRTCVCVHVLRACLATCCIYTVSRSEQVRAGHHCMEWTLYLHLAQQDVLIQVQMALLQQPGQVFMYPDISNQRSSQPTAVMYTT